MEACSCRDNPLGIVEDCIKRLCTKYLTDVLGIKDLSSLVRGYDSDSYRSLINVLFDAVLQASEGKGKERHGEAGKPFEKQDICQEARDLGLAYPIGQARKKAKESMRLEPGHAYQELLGAINYLAAAAIVVKENDPN